MIENNSYWINLDTGEKFANRKEAKERYGKFVFNRLHKEQKIIRIENLNPSADCGTLCTNTSGL